MKYLLRFQKKYRFCILLLLIVSDLSAQIFVDSSAVSGSNDGTSWPNAYITLTDALAAAAGGDSIFVSKGTYYPDEYTDSGIIVDSDNSSISFDIPDNVVLLGGFCTSSFDTTISSRDWKRHQTILSGDIDQDELLNGNSYHVVNCSQGLSAELDGFKVTAGNATGSTNAQRRGGGIWCNKANIILRNMLVTGNRALVAGGGMTVTNESNLTMLNCILSENHSVGISKLGGGAIYTANSKLISVNTDYVGNLCDDAHGGAINGVGSVVDLVNCTITGNASRLNGSALLLQERAQSSIRNCILWNNWIIETDTSSGQIVSNDSSLVVVENSIIQHSGGSGSWSVSNITDGGGNLDSDPLFVLDADPTSTPNSVGVFQLKCGSPAINFGANNLYADSFPPVDLAGNERHVHSSIDMGAYEFFDRVWHVDSAAASGGDGLSWKTAFNSLQDALLSACEFDSIYVSKGSYYPDLYEGGMLDLDDQAVSFSVPDEVVLLGGFSTGNGDTTLDKRDWIKYQTILSGDIDQDGTEQNNSYNVIKCVFGVSAELDGFIVSAGNANGTTNIQRRGGGIFCNNVDIILRNMVITGNRAIDAGGGMVITNGSKVMMMNSSLSANRHTINFIGGGAIYIMNSELTSINTEYIGNKCDFDPGGAIYAFGADVDLVNCTVSGNASEELSSALLLSDGTQCSIQNCIVWNNWRSAMDTTTVTIVSEGNSDVVISNSIIQNSGGSGSWSVNNVIDGGRNRDVDPAFEIDSDPLTSPNSTGDLRLRFYSPAIDAGDKTLYADTFVMVDLAGNERIFPDEIDMGAYEYFVPCEDTRVLYVDSAAVAGGDGLSWSTPFRTLQDALKYPCEFDSIFVGKGTYYPDEFTNTDTIVDSDVRATSFILPDSIVVLGGFCVDAGDTTLAARDWKKHETILSGDIDQNEELGNNSYHVLVSSQVSDATILDGFTISGGNANGDGAQSRGGGIFNNHGDIVIRNCKISDNSCSQGGGGMIVANQSKPTLTNNLWVGNRAQISGGAIDVANSDVVLINNAFKGNRAVTSRGGAVNNRLGGTSTIINSTFSGNAAAAGGAIANIDAGSLTKLDNCIVWNNRSGNSINAVSASVDNADSGTSIIRSSILDNSGGSDAWNNAIGSDGGGNKDVDPEFVTDANPSGAANESGDLRLMPTSPAVNCGSDILYSDTFPDYDLACGDRLACGRIDMGAFEVLDTVAPTITCPLDTTIDCMASTDTMYMGFVEAEDLFGIDTIYYRDSLTGDQCLVTDTLFRTFIILDKSGNIASCTQLIILAPPDHCTTVSTFDNGAWDIPPSLSRMAIIADDYDTATYGGFDACTLTVHPGVVFEVQQGDLVNILND